MNTPSLVIMPLLGGIISPVLSFLVYRISRRRLQRQETLKSSAHLFYSILSGVLLGQFLFHTQMPTYLTMVCIGIGYALLMFGESIARIWNTNQSYISNEVASSEDVGLNREDMVDQTIVVAKNLNSTQFASQLWTLQHNSKEQRKRWWLLGVLFVIFAVISVMDGMIPLYRIGTEPEAAITTSFMINGIAMSTSIYGAMLHAKIHVREVKRTRIILWTILTAIWSIILICSTIPVLVNVPYSLVKLVVENQVFLCFYGLAAGCVLRMHQYYHDRKVEVTEKKQVIVAYIVFVLCMAQAAVTGIWL